MTLFRRLSIFLATLLFLPRWSSAQGVPAFSQVIVFGDSLSDDGNIKHVVQDKFFISFPSQIFNYSDGRFDRDGEVAAGSPRKVLASCSCQVPAQRSDLGKVPELLVRWRDGSGIGRSL